MAKKTKKAKTTSTEVVSPVTTEVRIPGYPRHKDGMFYKGIRTARRGSIKIVRGELLDHSHLRSHVLLNLLRMRLIGAYKMGELDVKPPVTPDPEPIDDFDDFELDSADDQTQDA